MPMVVGILPGLDTVQTLVNALKAGSLDVERLQVISGDTPTAGLATTGVEFVLSGEAEESAISPGAGAITSIGGTGVPGLTDFVPHQQAFRNRSLTDSLGDLEISEARLDDYAEAVENGRAVAGYPARADAVDGVKQLFSQAGATTVEVF